MSVMSSGRRVSMWGGDAEAGSLFFGT
jgi:hypothetical protein